MIPTLITRRGLAIKGLKIKLDMYGSRDFQRSTSQHDIQAAHTKGISKVCFTVLFQTEVSIFRFQKKLYYCFENLSYFFSQSNNLSDLILEC